MGGDYPRGLSYYKQEKDKHGKTNSPGQGLDHPVGSVSLDHTVQSSAETD